MSRQDANAAFALSSFLQGTNATYIDDLYARYEQDPTSVDAEWQEFFKSLKDDAGRRPEERRRPVLGTRQLAAAPRDELTSALDGNWARSRRRRRQARRKAQAGAPSLAADINQATRDSFRALMLIRAYRMRGHFHAKLDPLGIEASAIAKSSIRAPTASPKPISTARSSSTTCSASNTARCARSSRSASGPTARRSASSSCISPTRRRRPVESHTPTAAADPRSPEGPSWARTGHLLPDDLTSALDGNWGSV